MGTAAGMARRRRRIRRFSSLADCLVDFQLAANKFCSLALVLAGTGAPWGTPLSWIVRKRCTQGVGGDLPNRQDRALGSCNTSQTKPVCPAQEIFPKAWLVGMRIVVLSVCEDSLKQQKSR